MVETQDPQVITLPKPLRVLTPHQISQIDRYLADIDAFGRITLIERNGKLRFIEKTESGGAIYLERWHHPKEDQVLTARNYSEASAEVRNSRGPCPAPGA